MFIATVDVVVASDVVLIMLSANLSTIKFRRTRNYTIDHAH